MILIILFFVGILIYLIYELEKTSNKLHDLQIESESKIESKIESKVKSKYIYTAHDGTVYENHFPTKVTENYVPASKIISFFTKNGTTDVQVIRDSIFYDSEDDNSQIKIHLHPYEEIPISISIYNKNLKKYQTFDCTKADSDAIRSYLKNIKTNEYSQISNAILQNY